VRTPIQRNLLLPGESAVFHSSGLAFLAKDADGKQVTQPVGNYVKVAPGRYTVRYRLHFPDLLQTGFPQSSDWQGDLDTAPVTVEVAAANKSAAAPAFGPVIERPILAQSNLCWALNLASGDLVSFTREHPLDFRVGQADSLRKAKVDLYQPLEANTADTVKALDMRLVSLGPEAWDTPAGEAVAQLDKAAAVQVRQSEVFINGRTVYVFATREGTKGVLQIRKDTVPAKLRYKLVKSATVSGTGPGTSPATGAAPQGGAAEYSQAAQAGRPATASTTSAVAPNPQAAADMVPALKGLFAALFIAILEKNDVQAGLAAVEALDSQTERFMALVKGTDAEPGLAAGVQHVRLIKQALREGKLDQAKVLLQGLDIAGPELEQLIRQQASRLPKTAAASSAPAAPAAGEVVERVLDFDTQRATAYLDLDTGEYSELGAKGMTYGMKATPAGVDLRSSSVESNFDVRWGINLAVVPVEPMRWEATPEEILMAVGSVKRQPEIRLSGGRSTNTWFFQTSEGGQGVLQFLPPKAGDDPSQVRLRYRLVQPASPSGSSTVKPKATTEQVVVEDLAGEAVRGFQSRNQTNKPTKTNHL
jgi:hypothetical protein